MAGRRNRYGAATMACMSNCTRDWRIIRSSFPSLDVHSPAQEVEIAPGIALPTLADEELFAYLAVHGASSAWFRLKWIADFAAILDARTGAEIERIYQKSQVLGAGRAAGQALSARRPTIWIASRSAGAARRACGQPAVAATSVGRAGHARTAADRSDGRAPWHLADSLDAIAAAARFAIQTVRVEAASVPPGQRATGLTAPSPTPKAV